MPDFTSEHRLCDDEGMVSAEPHAGPFEGTYLDFLNHLRGMSGHALYEGEAFACTGSAHLAWEHIRCTGPAHARSAQPSAIAARVEEIDACDPPEGLIAVLIRRPHPGPAAGTLVGLDLAQAFEALGIGYGDEFAVSRVVGPVSEGR